jgi:hypothetical protein
VTAWLALAAWLSGAIPVPEPASALKWQHGRAVALTGRPGSPALLVFAESAAPVRIDVRRALPAARQAEVLDFAADAGGALHALVLASFPLGRDRRFLCRFEGSGDAGCEDLDERRCRLLAADAPDSVWCFGPGPAGMLLHRAAGPRTGPRFWLPAEGPFRVLRDAARLWLAAPAPGRVRLLAPEDGLLADVDLASGDAQIRPMPQLRSLPGASSFAFAGERILGLLPLDRSRRQERLDEPYGLFELRGAWRRIAPQHHWLRGARLAGAEDGAAWIWNRHVRRVERIPLPPP